MSTQCWGFESYLFGEWWRCENFNGTCTSTTSPPFLFRDGYGIKLVKLNLKANTLTYLYVDMIICFSNTYRSEVYWLQLVNNGYLSILICPTAHFTLLQVELWDHGHILYFSSLGDLSGGTTWFGFGRVCVCGSVSLVHEWVSLPALGCLLGKLCWLLFCQL